jgi:ferredoxin/flavodoxin---NADP+ reductase
LPTRTIANIITEKTQLNPQVKLIKIYAPAIAEKSQAGQFVILKALPSSERIPLTLASWDVNAGTITLIFQEVGYSTIELGALQVGEVIQNLAGPLGNPSSIQNFGKVIIVCGGVGTAAAYPIAKALKNAGNQVYTIMGARNKDLLILEEEMEKVSDELYLTTDDGSKGHKGLVTEVLKNLISASKNPQEKIADIVYAIGPPVMMNAVSEVTRPYGIKTIVSLNPIMVDGMGMCGACRVSIDEKTRFACVDGPEFDAHHVNFKELIQRLKNYSTQEKSIPKPGGNCTCHNHQ